MLTNIQAHQAVNLVKAIAHRGPTYNNKLKNSRKLKWWSIGDAANKAHRKLKTAGIMSTIVTGRYTTSLSIEVPFDYVGRKPAVKASARTMYCRDALIYARNQLKRDRDTPMMMAAAAIINAILAQGGEHGNNHLTDDMDDAIFG